MPTLYTAGEKVEVRVWISGNELSNRWTSATITKVYTGGRVPIFYYQTSDGIRGSTSIYIRKLETDAADALLERKRQVNELLDKIRAEVSETNKDEIVNWGHVGSMNYVIELLTQAAEFINGTAK